MALLLSWFYTRRSYVLAGLNFGEQVKTAGRENPNRYTTVLVAFRAYGTEAENNPAQWGGLDVENKSGHRRSVFFLTPFIDIELIRTLTGSFYERSGSRTHCFDSYCSQVLMANLS
jgi:hypothetical protein